jgi:hypothetical protein
LAFKTYWSTMYNHNLCHMDETVDYDRNMIVLKFNNGLMAKALFED